MKADEGKWKDMKVNESKRKKMNGYEGEGKNKKNKKSEMYLKPFDFKKEEKRKIPCGEQVWDKSGVLDAIQETCLMEVVVSFLESTCIVPSYENVTGMCNFVSKTAEASEFPLKSKLQIRVTNLKRRPRHVNFYRTYQDS